jgi:hypothetical protein
MTNKEEYRYQINEQEAYLLLLTYWRSKATLFGGKELATEEDVAAYAQAWERTVGA